MNILKKSITQSFEIIVEIDWKCPYCNYYNITSYKASPYTVIAEDSPEELCEDCKEFCKLNFYENE